MHQVKLRSPVAVWFLGFLTLGIYYWYWFYKANEEAAILSNDENANPGLSLLAATLGAIVIVPAIWTHITTANRVGRATGYEAGMLAKIAFSCVPIVNFFYPFYIQGKLNKFGRRQRAQMHAAGAATA
jgi:hypothetical protein